MTLYMIFTRNEPESISAESIRLFENPYDIFTFLLTQADVSAEIVNELSPRMLHKRVLIIPAYKKEWVIKTIKTIEKGDPIYA